MTGEIVINGKKQPHAAANVAELLQQQGKAQRFDPQRRGVAVALNGTLVPRAAWAATPLNPGDRVEIVRAAAGG